MCTITLIPHPDWLNGFVLTSNRDEAVSRLSLPPQMEFYNGNKLYFPKDKKAGGTWVGVSENMRCVCLMNGAEQPHVRKNDYRKSRGVVVKDFLAGKKLKYLLWDYDLEDIEPFTMILVDWQNGLMFKELIWNGDNRKVSKLPLKEHIWSSSPLYTKEMKNLRRKWFNELKQSRGFSAKTLLDFHHNAGQGNKESDLIIDRGFLKTQSITQVHNTQEGIKFWYKDLIDSEVTEKFIQFSA
ncbi:NRDE family protein [Christiangramia crocea]|uniref:NRDE family protein n=1 Tax=Christiangramia crocea TaxID=2904124 RepID=A0A9X1UUX6_9FLAO|nr:NRDE family protein [Gramella crocea]MCG9970039.1 NRDE family protein [Gramella crocea]